MLRLLLILAVMCVLLPSTNYAWADAGFTAEQMLTVTHTLKGEITGESAFGGKGGWDNTDIRQVCSPEEPGGMPVCLLIVINETDTRTDEELLTATLSMFDKSNLAWPPYQRISMNGLRFLAYFKGDDQITIAFSEVLPDGTQGTLNRLTVAHTYKPAAEH